MSTKQDTVQSTRVIHLRMFMYILTISVHVINVGLTHVWCFKIADDPELKLYYPLWPRLFTFWNIVMQVTHAVFGLISDIEELSKTKSKNKLIKYVRSCNSTFFSSAVWPSAWVSCVIFWFFFNYDRNLLRYNLLKKIMHPLTNHIGHTFILVVVLWEAILRPREEPKSHRRNVGYALFVTVLYTAVLWYTFATSGTWVYPFFDVSYGTIYFPLIHIATALITVGSYYAQWPISRITLPGVESLKKDKKLLMDLSLQKRLQ